MRRSPLLCFVLGLTLVAAGCDQKQKAKRPAGTDSSPAVADPASAELPAPMGLPAEGTFGTLTIPVAAGDDTSQEWKPLTIEDLKVEVSVVGRAARTRVTQVFKNHTSGRTEGEYTFRLPRDASITRLAMTVGSELVEGEVVERERARNIYEKIVRTKKDPALLEWLGDGRFSTKIFPIEPNSTKTVVLEYEQMLPQDRGVVTYAYGLPNLDEDAKGASASKFKKFSFALSSADAVGLFAPSYAPEIEQKESGGGSVTLGAASFQPAGPVIVRFAVHREGDAQVVYGRRGEDTFAMLDVTPPWSTDMERAERAKRVVFALDTSAGLGAPVVERAAKTVEFLAKGLFADTEVLLVTGDFTQRPCSSEPLTPEQLTKCVSEVTAGGGTDLGGLLDAALGLAKGGEGQSAVVVLTDGAASLGELDGGLLSASAQRATRSATHRVALHTVALGHAPDEEFLLQLARASRGQTVRVTPNMPPALAAEYVSRMMAEPLLEDVTFEVVDGKLEDLTSSGPTHVARGSALAVLGKLKSPTATVAVRGTWKDEPWERRYALSAPKGEGSPQLATYWARGHIDRLVAASVPRGEVVETSIEYGVMSPYTSFLVLENEKMFKDFDVQRRRDAARKEQERAQQAQAIKNLEKGKGSLQDVLDQSTSGKRAKGEEGAFGEAEEEPPADAKPTDPELLEPGALREIFGSEDGFDAKMNIAMEGDGGELVIGRGSGGMGMRGTGLGGGGEGFGRIGGLGKIDTGGGKARGRSNKRKMRKPTRPRPAFKVGRVFVEGSCDAWNVERATRAKARAMQYCFEKETYRNTTLSGTVKLSWSVDEEGWPRSMGVDATKGVRDVGSCMQRVLKRTRYAKPQGMCRVTQRYDMGRAAERRTPVQEESEWLARLERLSAPSMDSLLDELRERDVISDPLRFAKLIDTWMASKSISPEDALTALRYAGIAQDGRITETYKSVLLEVGKRRALPADDIASLIALMVAKGRLAELDQAIDKSCGDIAACEEILEELGRHEGASGVEQKYRERLATLWRTELEKLSGSRSEDMGNTELIIASAKLLEKLGEQERAARLLSEIVEFSPHDHPRRSAYARQLEQRGRTLAACAQYATAVQLDPAERDTFRTMMALRRAHEDKAKGIRSCLVDGVSKLPVQRSVSLLLTWEDPSADVDLHIKEVGGEEVWYQHTESKLGGLLYYDITDGFGPEIYVLGSGPAGTYELSLVYFRGRSRPVEGTLTVLRHAGSPEETRTDIPFTLDSPNSSVKVPIGSFEFTDADDPKVR